MPGRPLTILQLTHQGGPAGSTQSIFNLSEHLARRGHRVLVGCRDDVLLARLARAARLDVVPFDFTRLGSLARALQGVIAQHGVAVGNSHGTRDRPAPTWLRWRGRLSPAVVVPPRPSPAPAAPCSWPSWAWSPTPGCAPSPTRCRCAIASCSSHSPSGRRSRSITSPPRPRSRPA